MDVTIGPLLERELPEADRIFRLAFGTFLGLPEPSRFAGDSDWVPSRWRTAPEAAFAASLGGELVGSVLVARWGSVGFFGPLTVRPDLWNRGVAKQLLEPTMDLFARWRTPLTGLFTFAHSEKHVGLYQRFGFWPRFLTSLMGRPVAAPAGEAPPATLGAPSDASLRACRELTDAVHPGLDVKLEIRGVAAQRLGDTVLVTDGSRVDALAVCHVGRGTEAGSGTCYVKFGAARPGSGAGGPLRATPRACDVFAAARGATTLVAGVNTARRDAYRELLASGFRSMLQGVACTARTSPATTARTPSSSTTGAERMRFGIALPNYGPLAAPRRSRASRAGRGARRRLGVGERPPGRAAERREHLSVRSPVRPSPATWVSSSSSTSRSPRSPTSPDAARVRLGVSAYVMPVPQSGRDREAGRHARRALGRARPARDRRRVAARGVRGARRALRDGGLRTEEYLAVCRALWSGEGRSPAALPATAGSYRPTSRQRPTRRSGSPATRRGDRTRGTAR